MLLFGHQYLNCSPLECGYGNEYVRVMAKFAMLYHPNGISCSVIVA